MKGECHCGQIQFTVTGEPTWIGTCHCCDCQRISGTAYTAFAEFKAVNVAITKGAPRAYQSSEKVVRSFCENCASPIMYVHDDYNDRVEMPIGIFDNPELLTPRQHIWISQKLPWDIICDDMPQLPRD